ncbi:MAG: hypothetical protein M1822_003853 [Bathelium mastoideum]|nr:MAG: hypothetical protein M1822_003853 [Bathelium mastoideum]
MVGAVPPEGFPHRGYSFISQESISGITGFAEGKREKPRLIDVKETFDMGQPGDTEYANRWPSDNHFPQFRAFMENQFTAIDQAHLNVLRAIALGLGLPTDYFVPKCNGRHHEMRLLHYPSMRLGDLKNGKARIADHTDFGSLTLLFQDLVGGLEGRDRNNSKYAAIQSDQRECLVMLGDCFQRWTGDYLWALPHRVTMPVTAQVDNDDERIPERFSIAFFGKPNRDADVGNLEHPQFQQTHYDSLTAGEYNNLKLVRTY